MFRLLCRYSGDTEPDFSPNLQIKMNAAPRLFISYSWSTPDHEQWVLDLATELVNSGVDVIIDKWNLREGHDSVAFMEKMISDESISKVIMVCDKIYVNKSDGRSGGVGTETQIISAEVYARQDQNKFVALIAEKDIDGKPYIPVYYKSRIYIDMSESERYSENFEKLLRWIFDKPIFVRPALGRPPSFIEEQNTITTATSALARRVVEGLRTDKSYVHGALVEYFSVFCNNIELFRIKNENIAPYDLVVKSIDDFVSSRNEYINVISTLAQYGDMALYKSVIHRFLESLIPYLSRPEHIDRWNEIDFDNFKFIVHEIFLYTMSLLIKNEHLDAARHILAQPYFIPGNSEYGNNSIVDYTVFREYAKSLEIRNRSMELRRLSLRADLLEQRSKSSGIQFRYLMQADFICFLFIELTNPDDFKGWWPETLIYASRHHGPFEIFARSVSKKYLSNVLSLLNVANLDEIKELIEKYSKQNRPIPRWEHVTFSPVNLIGFDRLGTRF